MRRYRGPHDQRFNLKISALENWKTFNSVLFLRLAFLSYENIDYSSIWKEANLNLKDEQPSEILNFVRHLFEIKPLVMWATIFPPWTWPNVFWWGFIVYFTECFGFLFSCWLALAIIKDLWPNLVCPQASYVKTANIISVSHKKSIPSVLETRYVLCNSIKHFLVLFHPPEIFP